MSKTTRKRKRRVNAPLAAAWIALTLSAVLMVVVGVMMFFVKANDGDVYAAIDDGTFYEGISVNGKSIGGLTYDEAWELLSEDVDTALRSVGINLKVGADAWLLSAADIGMYSDLDDVLFSAMALGRDDSVVNNAKKQNELKEKGENFDISYSIHESIARDKLAVINETVCTLPINATCTPVSVSAEMKPTFNYIDGVDGKVLDIDAALTSLSDAVTSGSFTATIAPEMVYQEPEITVETLKASLTQRSYATTWYGDSSSHRNRYRIANVFKAASMLCGTMIENEAVFSFNEFFGPRTEADGWQLAPGIVDGGRYEDQPGGGICQVSTTLYNALLLAGPEIEIVERHNHSIRATYADYGLDATVSYGGPDLVFKNNTGAPIYIFAFADNENYITHIYIYGLPLEEGVRYEIEGKLDETIPQPENSYQDMPNWPTGFEYTFMKGREGYKATAYRYKYVNDQLVDTEVLYRDYYREKATVIQRGVGDPNLPKPQITG